MNDKDLVIARLTGMCEVRYREYVFYIHDNEYIEMVKPEHYEVGTLQNFRIKDVKDITNRHIESWICDYYGIPDRDFELSKEERAEIRRNFSAQEMITILGMHEEEAKYVSEETP